MQTLSIKATGEQDISIDPDFQQLIPPLSADEVARLEQDLVKSGGPRDPLVTMMLAGKQVLLDGHHRYAICRRHNLPFRIITVDLPHRDAAKAWIVANQLARRNLPDFVRIELARALEPQIAADARQRMASGKAVPKSTHGRTRTALAKVAGVSESTLDEAKYISEHATEEQKAALKRGDTKIHTVFRKVKANAAQAHAAAQAGAERIPERGVRFSASLETETGVPLPPPAVLDELERELQAVTARRHVFLNIDGLKALKTRAAETYATAAANQDAASADDDVWLDSRRACLVTEATTAFPEWPTDATVYVEGFQAAAGAAVTELAAIHHCVMGGTGRSERASMPSAIADDGLFAAITTEAVQRIVRMSEQRTSHADGESAALSSLHVLIRILNVDATEIAEWVQWYQKRLWVMLTREYAKADRPELHTVLGRFVGGRHAE